MVLSKQPWVVCKSASSDCGVLVHWHSLVATQQPKLSWLKLDLFQSPKPNHIKKPWLTFNLHHFPLIKKAEPDDKVIIFGVQSGVIQTLFPKSEELMQSVKTKTKLQNTANILCPRTECKKQWRDCDQRWVALRRFHSITFVYFEYVVLVITGHTFTYYVSLFDLLTARV